jgi:hypothetical protein
MDRRRFNPSAEGLEGRELLSLFGGSTAKATQASLQNIPTTFKQKELRIAHLPFFLEQEYPNRFLPEDTIKQLQADLTSVIASLHAPPAPVANAFNSGLRHLMVYKTLSRENALRLNDSFGSVLVHAGATPEQVANLQADMTALAKVDALSPQPSLLARSDYSLVLQTALAVGRPMETPTAPSISATDGTRNKGGASGYTADHHPLMTGTYQAGATTIGYVRMQIIDSATGAVIGEAPVDGNGAYNVKVSTYLPDGKYALRTRAIDEVGHMSAPSPRAFTLRVLTRTPKPTAPAGTAAAGATLSPPGGPLALLTPK